MSARSTMVFHSGRVFDGHRLSPRASAVVVREGKILFVGSDAQALETAGPGAEAIDLAGRLILPGFTDAHIHAVTGGMERLGCDLSQHAGERAVLERVREYADANTGGWITGGGWNMADFPGGTPTREQLDAVVPNLPAYLVNRDHHGAWVNSRALELAGIDARTPDPVDGRIERAFNGSPSGTLHEGAMDLVARHLPATTVSQQVSGLREAQDYLHSVGVVGWQEAIVGDLAGQPDISAAYLEMIGRDELSARVSGALWVPRTTTVDDVGALVESFRARRQANAAGGFDTRTAKLMVDGVPENRTAAMLEPYSCGCDGDDGRGLLYLGRDVLDALVSGLDGADFDMHMHVIGDRAVRHGLDALQAARLSSGALRGRHHMAHLQVIDPADVPRLAELGVTANVQAIWACNDAQMLSLTSPVLGATRTGFQYPFASLARAGTGLAMGSDWPVSSPDPWQAIHVAVSRRPPGDTAIEPLVASEAIDLESALAAYTSGSALLMRQDGVGLLRPGALADLVVVDRDPFAGNVEELHLVRTDMTMVGGRMVYERALDAAPK